MLGITLNCATTKHPQTIGKSELTHASPRTNLKIARGEYRRQGHKYLPLTVLNHKTSYLASIACEPTRVFSRRIPHNILDHKRGHNPKEQTSPTTEIAKEIGQNSLLTRRNKILCNPTSNIYEDYYDRKAKATALKENYFCFVLQPKNDQKGRKSQLLITVGLDDL